MLALPGLSGVLELEPHGGGNDLESPVDQVGGRLGRAEEALDDHVRDRVSGRVR